MEAHTCPLPPISPRAAEPCRAPRLLPQGTRPVSRLPSLSLTSGHAEHLCPAATPLVANSRSLGVWPSGQGTGGPGQADLGVGQRQEGRLMVGAPRKAHNARKVSGKFREASTPERGPGLALGPPGLG